MRRRVTNPDTNFLSLFQASVRTGLFGMEEGVLLKRMPGAPSTGSYGRTIQQVRHCGPEVLEWGISVQMHCNNALQASKGSGLTVHHCSASTALTILFTTGKEPVRVLRGGSRPPNSLERGYERQIKDINFVGSIQTVDSDLRIY